MVLGSVWLIYDKRTPCQDLGMRILAGSRRRVGLGSQGADGAVYPQPLL